MVSLEYDREVCTMQDTETVLNVIRERGERGLPLENIYRLLYKRSQKWLRKSEQGDKWNRCLIEGMIVPSETGARDEQTTPP